MFTNLDHEYEIHKMAKKLISLHLSHTAAPITFQLFTKTTNNRINTRSQILTSLGKNQTSTALILLNKSYNVPQDLFLRLKNKEFLEHVHSNNINDAIEVGRKHLGNAEEDMLCLVGYRNVNVEGEDLIDVVNGEMCMQDGEMSRSALWVAWMQYQNLIYYLNNM
ncbi:hypothetical protein COBT_000687 [Conglomerata obtusa]